MKPAQIARHLATDLVLWYAAPAIFLFVYIRAYSAPVQAVVPHLLVLAMPLSALLLARLTFSTVFSNAFLSRAVSAVVLCALVGSQLVYYAIVIVGLHSWGGVVAWDVIPTCFAQAPQLADALGIPPLLTLGAILLVFAGLLAACWLYLRRFDWTAPAVRKVSGWTSGVLISCSYAILAIAIYEFRATPWTDVSEPVSLTLFAQEAGAEELEGHHMDRLTAKNIDRSEEAARVEYVPAVGGSRKNVILIVVDALRPDHMGIYGYGRDTTPNLSRLASKGVVRVVSGVHSSCGDTICGLLSLSSSKFPRRFSFHPFTLQQVLRRNGYRIHMILSGDHTNFYSLKKYYGKVDSFYDGTNAQAQGYFINDDQFLVDQVAAMPDWDGAPAMFQFHVMSTHILRMKERAPGKFQPATRYLFPKSADTGPGGYQIETATNFYDNGVVKTDAIIQDLLTKLQSKGYLRNTLVVITADHGESLGEHGLFSHTNSVREQLLRIPLLMISYGYTPERPTDVRAFSSQVDIAPTILAECGLPAPATWSGRALQEAGDPDFTYFEQRTYVGLIDHRDPGNVLKYWVDASSGVEHVFNLSADPAEDSNVTDTTAPARIREWRLRTLSGNGVALAQH
jgi:glucan phosphoethanolaminetransferase (alkaline phosphatase superfamily)